MKEVIMLIDKGNSKFMFEKENDIYTLPVLNNISNLDEIEKNLLDKYSIIIDSHSIIEEAEDYTVVKAITKDKLNTKQYSHAVLNEILPNVSNENQIQALSRIKNKIFLETINDSFWLGVILSVEDKVSNYGTKYILTDFLLQFSSIFCEEVINYKFGEIKNRKFMHKEIKELRNSYLKKCPIIKSKEIKNITLNLTKGYLKEKHDTK